MKILITGAAGFIGFHLTKRFLNEKLDVIGFDSLNDYLPFFSSYLMDDYVRR